MNPQIKKLSYFECQKEEHNLEPLSRVCVDQNCGKKTLVCCICEELEHQRHKTLPLKLFLQTICRQSAESTNILYFTNLIDQSRSNYFSTLKTYRNEIEAKLDELETQGKIYFNEIEQAVLNLAQVDDPLSFITQNSKMNNQKRTVDFLNKILKLADLEDKSGFSVKNKLEEIAASVKSKENLLSTNLTSVINEMSRFLNIILLGFGDKSSAKIKTQIFSWSKDLKGAKMKIEGPLIEQQNMESSGQRFAMMQPSLSEYGAGKKICWGIKIKKFVGWVGLGICLKNVIKQANFHFNYTNIGHGSYLISSNGYSWSHSIKDMNSSLKSFQFAVNDIVYVEYDPLSNVVRFRKGDTDSKFELTISPPPAGDFYHPCVNLCSTGDSVQAIFPGKPLS